MSISMPKANLSRVEYIWLDGVSPTQELRSKTKILELDGDQEVSLESFPMWNFDGSSTEQAAGEDSDCLLKPVFFCPDPTRSGDDWLVMCEVMNPDGTPHASNHRSKLAQMMRIAGDSQQPWIGFEQEYTLYQGGQVLGWPDTGFPAPQGPYYCGVGNRNIYGREVAEEHMEACLIAGLALYGINAEVMPGQWEFQIGFRGLDQEEESADPLNMADHLWMARWLLHRIAEEHDVHVSFDCKPVKGDWNGAGLHTNFSTAKMRTEGGLQEMESAMDRLSAKHVEHLKEYGADLHYRLTGFHETSSMDKFSYGTADRGRSVRIPTPVKNKGYGYFEDRRPGANADPYRISACLVEAVCEVSAGKLEAAA